MRKFYKKNRNRWIDKINMENSPSKIAEIISANIAISTFGKALLLLWSLSLFCIFIVALLKSHKYPLQILVALVIAIIVYKKIGKSEDYEIKISALLLCLSEKYPKDLLLQVKNIKSHIELQENLSEQSFKLISYAVKAAIGFVSAIGIWKFSNLLDIISIELVERELSLVSSLLLAAFVFLLFLAPASILMLILFILRKDYKSAIKVMEICENEVSYRNNEQSPDKSY